GSCSRWKLVGSKTPEVFGMPVGEPQPSSLPQPRPPLAGVWRAMPEKYALKPYDSRELVAWPFADYVFGCEGDVMSDVTKSRRFGFHDVVDTEEMFCRLLRRFREDRIVP